MVRIKTRYVGATALYCGIIFLMSSQSEPPTADWEFFSFPASDKILHALLYAGLAGIISVGLWRSNDALRPALHFWMPVVFSVIFKLLFAQQSPDTDKLIETQVDLLIAHMKGDTP